MDIKQIQIVLGAMIDDVNNYILIELGHVSMKNVYVHYLNQQ